MKKYRITVIALFIIGIAAFIVAFISRSKVNSFGERTNTECSTTERVFDYYGLLSSSVHPAGGVVSGVSSAPYAPEADAPGSA